MKILKHLYLTLIGITWLFSAHAQSKISGSLLSKMESHSRVDCMIYFYGAPDLDAAYNIRGKNAKGRYVIQALKNTAQDSQKEVIGMLEAYNTPFQSFWIANAVKALLTPEQVHTLAGHRSVAWIAYNSPVRMEPLPETGPLPFQSALRGVEWGISHIRADEVWDLGFTGEGVVIAGQDTGYEWEHTTLIEKYRGYDPVSGTADHNYHWHDAIHNAGQGNPCGSNSPEPCDDNNHGTHTMGTMAGDDGGANQIGVAPGSKWIGCRNMDEGDGTPATYMECFEWFLEPTDLDGQNPDPAMAPHVINNSWSCPLSEGCDNSNFEAMRQVIESLKAAGIVVVVSNGNSGPNCGTTSAPPAFYTESFSIGATNSSAELASFSSRGPSGLNGSLKPNVSAPGVSVRSAIRNNGYASYSGTSMAGPHVAGVVALMISANPNLAGEVEVIEEMLEETAIPKFNNQTCGGIPGSESPNNAFGYGIIDAFEAVEAAIGFLPAELVDFQLSMNTAYERVLSWTMQSDGDVFKVQLERSRDVKNWVPVHTMVLPSGTTHWQFNDRDPLRSVFYYRLVWQNEDGDSFFSHIVSAVADALAFEVFPNPVSEALQVRCSSPEFVSAEYRILDMLGKIHAQGILTIHGRETTNLPVSNLPEGIYQLLILDRVKDSTLGNYRFVRQQ
jgi:serine protease AprX